MSIDIASIRSEYTKAELSEHGVCADPLDQFIAWFDEALASDLKEPSAMALSTASQEGAPSSRVVLLKGLHEGGFVWYTNYQSRKGHELEANNQASLLFFWPELERQIRIEGTVERVDAETSTKYFQSRPRESQLGALASPQSTVVASRESLEQRFAELMQSHANVDAIPRPPNWGGFVLTPHTLEFWQGRASRMHDRIRYRKSDGAWVIERLAP